MESVRLKNIVKLKKGKKVDSFRTEYVDGCRRYIQIDDLRNDLNIKYTSSNGVEVKNSDVLIAWDGANAGTVGYGISGVAGSTISCLEIFDRAFETAFIGKILQSKFKLIQANCTGATIPHVSRDYLLNLTIPRKPLEEQKEIVQTLDTADNLRQKRKEQLVLLDDYLKSVFLDMFGDPVANSKQWKTVRLIDVIVRIIAGWSVTGELRPKKKDEYGVLKISAVTYGFFQNDEYKAVKKDLVDKNLVHPLRGDILFSRANTRELVGASCLVNKDYYDLFLPDKLWKVVVNEEIVNPVFFQKTINNERFRLKLAKKATGTSGSMLNISKDKFISEQLILPPITMQNKFASIIEQVEQTKQKMCTSLDEMDNHFNSLMQRCFR